jgi:hypothetical protein
MSNEGWRDRQILHLFLGGSILRARCKKRRAHDYEEQHPDVEKNTPLTRWIDNTIGPKRHLALCAQNASDST